MTYFEKNYNKVYKLFLNSKYLWGGKTAKELIVPHNSNLFLL